MIPIAGVSSSASAAPEAVASSGGGDVFSSLTSALSAARANKSNREIMRQQYEREDTAYTRAVADMRRAGLNPALMFGSAGPADSGAGGVGHQQAAVTPDVVHSALAAARLRTEISAIKQQTRTAASQERANYQSVNESEAREALAYMQRDIVGTEDLIKRAQLVDEQRRADIAGSKYGRALGWVDRTTQSLGGILNAVVPTLAAGKGLFMARKFLQSQDPIERTRSAHEHAYASERGRIDARNKYRRTRR